MDVGSLIPGLTYDLFTNRHCMDLDSLAQMFPFPYSEMVARVDTYLDAPALYAQTVAHGGAIERSL